ADDIERNEEAVRHGSYAALRAEERPAAPVVECDLGPDCLARRTVRVREGAPAVGVAIGDLPLIVERLRRDQTDQAKPPAVGSIRAGDELVLAGTAGAIAQGGPAFPGGPLG